MKIIVTILALLNGGYMMADGVFVMINGKYIGPDKPGPWAALFEKLDVNVFKLGPLFIVLGTAWLLFLAGLWTQQTWSFLTGIIISILTLWYIPLGTIFSLAILILLFVSRQKLGL